MKGFFPCLKKDIKLMLRGAGLFSLLFPLLLLLALWAGGGDLSEKTRLSPFPIAVRDRDDTFMSRSLTAQIREVSLFSQVVVPKEGESDEALFSQGCAAVITIPKDFFYRMYTMDNQVVDISLNGEMPVEASLFSGVAGSVLEIIAGDQAAQRAVYRFAYGVQWEEQSQSLWRETAQYLLEDALGRQAVFSASGAMEDTRDAGILRILSCCVSLCCLFFPLSAAKTLLEEGEGGGLYRYLAGGGGKAGFYCSKYLSALLYSLPPLLALFLLFPRGLPHHLVTALVLFTASFGFFALVGTLLKSAVSLQRFGNLWILFSLVLGGALYHPALLPAFARPVQWITVPAYALKGLQSAEGGWGEQLRCLWPVLLFGGICWAAFLALFPGKAGKGKPGKRGKTNGFSLLFSAPWAAVSHWKLKAMSGGAAGVLLLVFIACACGAAASSALSAQGPDSLALGVVLEENTSLARELKRRVGERSGVAVTPVEPGEERAFLSAGKGEGLLTVPQGFEEALRAGEEISLTYESAAGSVSGEAAREIIAGQVSLLRAKYRSVSDARRLLNREIRSKEEEELLSLVDEEMEKIPPLYKTTVWGKPQSSLYDPFAPTQLGLASFVVTLTLFTWGAWMGHRDARRVETRLAALPGGLWLSYGTDILSLFFPGLFAGLCALLFGGTPEPMESLALVLFTLCASALSLAVGRFTALGGRMDALAPFTALITCLLGGCFGDLGKVSPVLRRLSLCTPQGLALEAGRGSPPCLFLLLGLSLILFLIGSPFRRVGKNVE